MKKTSAAKFRCTASDDMLPEYHLDYSKAKPNRFAGRADEGRVVVVLDPDVSEVFTTPESVNTVLRALIKTVSTRTKSRTVRKTSTRQLNRTAR